MAEFVDAQAMSQKHPETFQAPLMEELDAITEGMHVKVCASDERFWCFVEKINADRITAIVDNELLGTEAHGLKYGDTVEFDKRHVYQILTEN